MDCFVGWYYENHYVVGWQIKAEFWRALYALWFIVGRAYNSKDYRSQPAATGQPRPLSALDCPWGTVAAHRPGPDKPSAVMDQMTAKETANLSKTIIYAVETRRVTGEELDGRLGHCAPSTGDPEGVTCPHYIRTRSIGRWLRRGFTGRGGVGSRSAIKGWAAEGSVRVGFESRWWSRFNTDEQGAVDSFLVDCDPAPANSGKMS